MASKQQKYIVDPKDISTKGISNEHELLKCADTDDSVGMVKYGIDLEEGMEKINDEILDKQLPHKH